MKHRFLKLGCMCGAVLAGAIATPSQPLSILTLAGNVVPGSTDGEGSTARFTFPIGVAVDGAGNVFVADTGNGTIRQITPDGVVSTFAGYAGSFGSANGAGTNASFYGPQGIAAEGAGFLYVADTANATIRRISPAGTVSTFAGAPGDFNRFDGPGTSSRFFHPEGIAVDSAGNVYVADTWNHTIRKITPAGVVSTLAGLAGNPGAADGTNSKARFQRPAGIALDAATNLFVADTLNHTIRKVTVDGAVTTIAGLAGVWGNADGTNNTARFFQPWGIVSASGGVLFVVDSGNQVIRRVSAFGMNWVVSTVAGLMGAGGAMNGTGAGAQFFFPAGIALDDTGELCVADSGNNTIRTTRVVPPTLRFTTSANQLILSWPTSATGFVLETAPTPTAGTEWSPLTNGVVIFGDNYLRTNDQNSGAAFYRLRKP